MVFDWFKKLGGNKARPRDDGDRTAVARRVAAAEADEAAPAAATATEEPARKPASVRVPTPAPRPAADGPDIPQEKIAQRAYEIWVRKGRPVGTSDQDWLQAEAELRAELPYRPESGGAPNKPR